MENIDIEKQYEDAVFKMLKRFAFISRQFCDKYCVPDGLMCQRRAIFDRIAG